MLKEDRVIPVLLFSWILWFTDRAAHGLEVSFLVPSCLDLLDVLVTDEAGHLELGEEHREAVIARFDFLPEFFFQDIRDLADVARAIDVFPDSRSDIVESYLEMRTLQARTDHLFHQAGLESRAEDGDDAVIVPGRINGLFGDQLEKIDVWAGCLFLSAEHRFTFPFLKKKTPEPEGPGADNAIIATSQRSSRGS